MERVKRAAMLDQVCKLVEEVTKKTNVLPEHRLFEDLAVDSLQFVKLVVGLENLFDIIIPDEWLTRERFADVRTSCEICLQLLEDAQAGGSA